MAVATGRRLDPKTPGLRASLWEIVIRGMLARGNRGMDIGGMRPPGYRLVRRT